MKEFLARFVQLLILFSVLVPILEISMVKASGTIIIGADGTVVGTDKIQREGNVYTLTDNIDKSIMVRRDNIVVNGAGYSLQGTGSGTGIDVTALSSHMNVTIKNIEIKEFTVGIDLHSFNEGVISENTIANNKNGIRVSGFGQFSSFGNIISGNTITNNENGITIDGYVVGNIISGNTITHNNYGLTLITWVPLHSPVEKNIISGNVIANNGNGICFNESSNNLVYHNDFVDNVDQVHTQNSVNDWNEGYPSCGNYWSDYEGTDNNGDGIGDIPYMINDGNQDRYPLMDPVVTPPIIVPEFPVEENKTATSTESLFEETDDQTNPVPTPVLIAFPIVLTAIIGAVFYRKKTGS